MVALFAAMTCTAQSAEAAPLGPRHQISGSVVADRGVLYFASTAPYMYAVSAEDGTELWRYRPPASIDDIETRDGVVYAIVGDELHAIDIQARAAKWVYSAKKQLGRAGMAFDRDLIFIEELFGDLIAIDRAKGRERWRMPTDGGLMPLVVSHSLVLEGGHGGVLRAFDVATGKERWKKSGFSNPELELSGKLAVVHTTQGWLTAIDVLGGHERWKVETKADLEAGRPVIKLGRVFAFARRSSDDPGAIFAVDQAKGKIAWVVESLAPEGELVAGDQTIDFAASSGETFVLDPKKGALRQKKPPFERPALKLPGDVFLYVDRQSLRAVERRTGDVKWRFRARFFDPEATISSRGTPPFTCPLGLEPTSAVRIRDWAQQRLDLGTTVVSANGHAAYVAREVEKNAAVVFKIAEAGPPVASEVPIYGDIWGAAAAPNGTMAVASQVPGGELAVSVLGAERRLTWTTTIAARKNQPSEPRLAWSDDRVAAVWTEKPNDREVVLRAVVLDPARRVALGATTVAEQRSLDFGSRIVPGEYDIAFDGEAFAIAYARIGPGSAMTISLARISRFGVRLGDKRVETLEIEDPRDGLIDLAASPRGLGIVYAGKFALLYRSGGFQSGPVPLPRHPRVPDRPTGVKIAWNGSLFGIAWGLSSDDSEAYVTVADLQGRMPDAIPLGRGGGAQAFELAGTRHGFFTVHIPDEAAGRKPRAAVGTWLSCRAD